MRHPIAVLPVAVALDQFGRKLDMRGVPTTGHEHRRLLEWVCALGTPGRFWVEGTGAYGAGLTRYLRRKGMNVVEVIRPGRQTRRRAGGKSDAIDAEAAARAVQAGTVMGKAKSQDGPVEMIRTLRLARRSAMKARTQAGPYPGRQPAPRLAARHQQLAQGISALDHQIDQLAHRAAPDLMQIKGIGVDTAAALLVAAGDYPGRLRSEASFAHMRGVAPIPAGSGKTNRNRLNRGGSREASRALYMPARSVCEVPVGTQHFAGDACPFDHGVDLGAPMPDAAPVTSTHQSPR
ncbi:MULTISPECIES: transposase [Streptomyces]|uniref:transposase n=1 Tax=Streptomyces lycopersici TaxID=2974589 RepID=UPI0021D1FED5|nr:transposase [Streptomyces sp. NEAU-383]